MELLRREGAGKLLNERLCQVKLFLAAGGLQIRLSVPLVHLVGIVQGVQDHTRVADADQDRVLAAVHGQLRERAPLRLLQSLDEKSVRFTNFLVASDVIGTFEPDWINLI